MDALRGVFAVIDEVGAYLKEAAGRRDVGIECLGPLFTDAFEKHFRDGQHDVNREFVLHLVRHFIDNVLPSVVRENKFIASFSRNATNPTMWGHYAAAERGFVVVYETNSRSIHVQSPIPLLAGSRPSKIIERGKEIGIYRDEHLALEEVSYSRRPPKVNAFHRLICEFPYSEMENHYDVPEMIGSAAAKKKENLVGLVKYSDWRYEKEVRAFFPTYEQILPDARVLQVDLANIVGIVFGPRMSSADKARAVLCCHLLIESRHHLSEERKEILFFQARQTIDRFDFDILPVGTLDRDYLEAHFPVKPMRELDSNAARRIKRVAKLISVPGSEESAGNCE